MKALTFLAISLLSGSAGGVFLGIVNQIVAEPFIDQAIGIEAQRDEAAGNHIDPSVLLQYRTWQKEGEIIAATVLGTALGALFALAFAYFRESLPGQSHVRKAVVLAGIMWVTLFLVTALKYPPNPPAVGNPDTLYYRQSLYVSFILISGLSAVGLALVYKKLKNSRISSRKVLLILLFYVIIITTAALALPPNPDRIIAPSTLVTDFRIATVLSMASYWVVMPVIFGTFWEKLKPHEQKPWRTEHYRN